MKVQQVNNQQTFKASGKLFPKIPESFEKLFNLPGVNDFSDVASDLSLMQVRAVLYNLREGARTGEIKRCLKDIVLPSSGYKETANFETSGNVITLYSKPVNPVVSRKSSAIIIGNGEKGSGGMIGIYRDSSKLPEDLEFDEVANALNAIG